MLREQIVTEIMKLVRPATAEVSPRSITPRPTIDELEKILNRGDDRSIMINPDGSVSVQPTRRTVGDVADAVLRVLTPVLGPLLDAWKNLPADVKDAMRESEPVLTIQLDKVSAAMGHDL